MGAPDGQQQQQQQQPRSPRAPAQHDHFPGRSPRRDLEGRVALVTGATSGLGLEAAAQLAERGAKVIFGVRNPAKAERVVAAIRKRFSGCPSPPSLDFVLPPAVPPLDVSDPASISRFARALLSDTATPLHFLINNAGSSLLPDPPVDERGVNRLVQVNYLGAYQLTRQLEAKLVADRCRVVTVSSVSHRSYELPTDPRVFLHSTVRMTYAWSKVANVLFAYELQRRLGPLGVQSCAVDPGGVRTSIWDEVPALAVPPAKWVIETLYAPPEDGAEVLVSAATRPWEQDRAPHVLAPSQDLRYYARGAFASPLLTLVDGAWRHWLGFVKPSLYGTAMLLQSLADYPLRRFSGGRVFNQTVPVRSAVQTYDTHLAAALWSYSEKVAGLTAAAHAPPPAPAEAAAHLLPLPLPLEGGGAGAGAADAVPRTPQDAGGAAATKRRPPPSPTVKLPGGGDADAEVVDSPLSAANPNRKRPVMSPAKAAAPDVQPSALARRRHASAGPECGSGSEPESAVAIAAAANLFPPAAAGGGGSEDAGGAARRRLVATRRESDVEDGAGGEEAAHGPPPPPPLPPVPPPPETLQHLAAEHGIVLPGPSPNAAGAATGAAGGGGEVLIVAPRFEDDELLPAQAAPPPHKRMHMGEQDPAPAGAGKAGGGGGGGGGARRRPAAAGGGHPERQRDASVTSGSAGAAAAAGAGAVPAPAPVVGLGSDAGVAAAAAAVTPTPAAAAVTPTPPTPAAAPASGGSGAKADRRQGGGSRSGSGGGSGSSSGGGAPPASTKGSGAATPASEGGDGEEASAGKATPAGGGSSGGGGKGGHKGGGGGKGKAKGKRHH
ncbi:hypothetical protein PLESTB_000894800 [Pleodorina starrii]|uniref:Uncharacterized protein n=1 Tax=Pleodorina starrii TaxID=330485 RepID=A0A9W6BMW5_9CHLO|nr:hypothetical protein PLESTM_000886200 [Pleodorina starrii]GLC54680.1 hypothetical protein PLESTB_000894800 [Pleodorina starrii]GLC67018.1 hypothetical protein PLESTF_000502600 [Pleodorina starrii]